MTISTTDLGCLVQVCDGTRLVSLISVGVSSIAEGGRIMRIEFDRLIVVCEGTGEVT